MATWKQLNQDIVNCQLCPRLIQHCQKVAEVKRKAYLDDEYWGKPVPNLGHVTKRNPAPILIVGLAPGAHGANRTGRMFTGDRSGDWLFRSMHKAGLASQSESATADDGLKLVDCVITAVCHCAPPDNKPTRDEVAQCRPWLQETIEQCRPKVLIALGGIAWTQTLRFADYAGWTIVKPRPKFGHGAKVKLAEGRFLLGSYHPSQQNTFTGRLTERMLDRVFLDARTLAGLDD